MLTSLIYITSLLLSLLTINIAPSSSTAIDGQKSIAHSNPSQTPNPTINEKKIVASADNVKIRNSTKNVSSTSYGNSQTQHSGIDEQKIISNAPHLNPHALDSALAAYHWAIKNGYVKNPNVLTVIDFTKPSNEKRAWLIDLKNSKVLMNFYTTHGKNSGLDYAKSFSNNFNSDQTSLGVYTTLDTYYGKHGLSERLKGLEKGVNSNALQRAVVVHPADYATDAYVKANGRAGRSWGCFGISPAESKQFINYTKNGSVIYAYASAEKNDPVLSA